MHLQIWNASDKSCRLALVLASCVALAALVALVSHDEGTPPSAVETTLPATKSARLVPDEEMESQTSSEQAQTEPAELEMPAWEDMADSDLEMPAWDDIAHTDLWAQPISKDQAEARTVIETTPNRN